MELVSKYVDIQKKRQAVLALAANKEPQLEEKPEVDLGDLIERLKIQIDTIIGR